MSEAATRLQIEVDPRTDGLAAADWIERYCLNGNPRMINLIRVFHLLGRKNGMGVSIQDVVRDLEVCPSTASYTLRRAVKISEAHSQAFPLTVTRKEVPDLSIPIGKRSVYTGTLNPEAVLSKVNLGHFVRTGETLPFDFEGTRKRLAAVLSTPDLKLTKADTWSRPPDIAPAIISNASWCFREERGDLGVLREIAANRMNGLATHITTLQQKRGMEIKKAVPYGCVLEGIAFANAFKCGLVVIQASDLPKGYYTVEFLRERCRRKALGCHYGPGGLRIGEDSPFYFDTEATDFNFDNFKERMKTIREGGVRTSDPYASDERQLALFQYVARQNHKGIYPSSQDVAEAVGCSKRTIGYRVSKSKEARHDISMYLRDRKSRGGFECKLLKKVRGA